MKILLIISLFSLAFIANAQIVSDNGHNYFVHKSGDGSATVFSDKGVTYIQPGPMGVNILNTGRENPNAVTAALLTQPRLETPSQRPVSTSSLQYPIATVPKASPSLIPDSIYIQQNNSSASRRQIVENRAKYHLIISEYKKLTASMDASTLAAFRKDMADDMGVKKGDSLSPKETLGYAKLWLRSHSEKKQP